MIRQTVSKSDCRFCFGGFAKTAGDDGDVGGSQSVMRRRACGCRETGKFFSGIRPYVLEYVNGVGLNFFKNNVLFVFP
ncbi:MAG: hypothetical protein Q3966_02105 [Neisseria sp.]|nr:hypothetical protein [Neisseria sp.]